MHLRIAESFTNATISKEIQENRRTYVGDAQKKVIELLRKSILPLMDVAVSI